MTPDELTRFLAAYRHAIDDGSFETPQWDLRMADAKHACASQEALDNLQCGLAKTVMAWYADHVRNGTMPSPEGRWPPLSPHERRVIQSCYADYVTFPVIEALRRTDALMGFADTQGRDGVAALLEDIIERFADKLRQVREG